MPETTQNLITTVEITLINDIAPLLLEVELDEETQQITELLTYSDELADICASGETVVATITEIVEYNAISFSIIVGNLKIPVHPSWIKTVNGEPIMVSTMFLAKRTVKLTAEVLLNVDTKELLLLADLDVCSECGEPLDIEGLKICSNCLETKYFNIKNYSFIPTYKFYGEQKGKLERSHPAYYGLELEYGLPRKRDLAKVVFSSEGPDDNKALYLKSDSSISGGEYRAELVTHPMSYDYLMSDCWIDQLTTLHAEDRPESNGCHIHISRTAFKHDKAFNKFKYLLLSNKKVLELVGGRSESHYAKFKADDTERTSTKDKVVGEKYNAVNQTHSHTIECRFMASTHDPVQVRRYLQFLDSMVKYTSYHATTASYAEYVKYVYKYRAKYGIINAFIQDNMEAFKQGEVTIKSYTKKVIPVEHLRIGDFSAVVRIIFTNTETGDVRETNSIQKDKKIYYREENLEIIKEIFGNYCEENEQITVEIIA